MFGRLTKALHQPGLAMPRRFLLLFVLLASMPRVATAEDGSELWLRYKVVADATLRARYKAAITQVVVDGDTPTLQAAREELTRGLSGLLGAPIASGTATARAGTLLVGTRAGSKTIAALPFAREVAALGNDGFIIREATVAGRRTLVVAANSDIGALYGSFALLRMLQTNTPVAKLALVSAPKIQLRMLDHWDNLDRSVERGYAGKSLWQWDSLPGILSPRYRDYARANASIGINGAALTNVNANAKVLTPEYLAKVAAIAGV